jgi:hypothetical protein
VKQMARKKRSTVDLPEELWKWGDEMAIKLSYVRGEKVSRNQVFEECIRIGREVLEKEVAEVEKQK